MGQVDRTKALIINVDDDDAVRYARNRVLTLAGFEVIDAATGEGTLDLVRNRMPDLVLLDVHLPDTWGTDLCRAIKTQAVGEVSLMVLQISASALTATHAKEALDAGADGYLMEPVDPDVLIATVRSLLRLRKAEQDLVETNRKLEYVNRELHRSNQDLEQFAFAASHDLQEPLRSISVFLELLSEEMQGKLTQDQQDYFRRVLRGADRMETLIRDLLSYSQVGREGRPQTKVKVADAVAAATQNLRQAIETDKAEVTVSPNLPAVKGDFVHLVSVFHNLLSNSLKYRKPDSPARVAISADRISPAEWQISVADNGIGIDEAYQRQIFEPFKRLHGSEIPGNGIGLAVCRRIIQANGGRMWVESGNNGSTFHLTLAAIEE